MAVTILKNTAPPPRKGVTYPFDDPNFGPGDAFFVEFEPEDGVDDSVALRNLLKRVSASCSMRKKNHPGEDYTVTTIQSDGKIGAGVFRLT